MAPPLYQKALVFAIVATLVVGGLALIAALFNRRVARALPFGLAAGLLAGVVSILAKQQDLRSEGGWGWIAVGAGVIVCLNVSAGFVAGLGVAAAISPRCRLLAPFLLILGLLVPALLSQHDRVARSRNEQRWRERQEAVRRGPHALVNDSALPDEEDSGYRVRFVDSSGAVRTDVRRNGAPAYLVLPPGKHWIVLHGDTPKAARLKIEWFRQGEVEVAAGRLYKLRVVDGHISLVDAPAPIRPGRPRTRRASCGRR